MALLEMYRLGVEIESLGGGFRIVMLDKLLLYDDLNYVGAVRSHSVVKILYSKLAGISGQRANQAGHTIFKQEHLDTEYPSSFQQTDSFLR